MTLEAAGLARKGFGAVAAVGEASWSLLDEAVLTSYRDTLKRIEEQGLGRYLARHYRPFVRAALGHFRPAQVTGVERWLGVRPQRQ